MDPYLFFDGFAGLFGRLGGETDDFAGGGGVEVNVDGFEYPLQDICEKNRLID
jgi:hypothetical protein